MKHGVFLLSIELLDGRFHGRPEWPPSPARVFQALVAGAHPLLDESAVAAALGWLEHLDPPVIAAPHQVAGSTLLQYVPNNDLDAVGGDPARREEQRVGKETLARWIEGGQRLHYAWPFDGGREHCETLRKLALRLYQLGRGADMAFAEARVLDPEALEELLDAYPGTVHRPASGTGGTSLACAGPGTLASLRRRHDAQAERFRVERRGRTVVRIFAQPPKARLVQVPYDSPPRRSLFELRRADDPTRFFAWPLEAAQALVVAVRDAAVARLLAAGLDASQVEAALVGPRPGEAPSVPPVNRARLIPVPSIGHVHADSALRRVLLEVSAGCPLSAADLAWSLSGLESEGFRLVAVDLEFLDRHFTSPARRFESLTPLALSSLRRRIDPARRGTEAKPGSERESEESNARRAVRTALRHAQVQARPTHVEVQREPFLERGERAERFASPPRFSKERLWHVAIEFEHALSGPLMLGDGRFLGLGLMSPRPSTRSVHALALRASEPLGCGVEEIARHLRRATLARVQAHLGPDRPLPAWISGHTRDGQPVPVDQHLRFAFVPQRALLLVIDPRPTRAEGLLIEALAGMRELVAGRLGRLAVEPVSLDPDDELLRASRAFESITPYRVERHRRLDAAESAVLVDVEHSLAAQGLPRPRRIEVLSISSLSGRGLQASLRLTFAVALPGPLSLGRGRHQGLGLFRSCRAAHV